MKLTLLTGKTFDLENAFDFPLKVNASFRSRRMTLRIDTKKRAVVLAMPKLCSKKKAWEFINSNLEWIENHLAKIPQNKDFENGERFSLLGREVLICHNPNTLGAAKEIDGILHVGGDIAFLHRRVKDYVKRQAKKEFLARSRELASKIGCEVANVAIKDTKSRWGSCSTLNNINYNWRIALAPECVIEYLIAHEVAHLKYQDHSQQFWRCVKQLYPGASLGRSWLKAHGSELYLYR